jgi:hypothetical protein
MTSSYKVMVDDNFHYMEEDERREHGSYSTLEDAISTCKGLVDRSLAASYRPGMTAAELFEHYASFGDDPVIVAEGRGKRASCSRPMTMRERVEAICSVRG